MEHFHQLLMSFDCYLKYIINQLLHIIKMQLLDFTHYLTAEII